jgi:hypothetical protein
MCVVHSAMRRGEDDLEDADRITAGDMRRALDLQESLIARRQTTVQITAAEDLQPAAASGPPPTEARPSAENVTPLTLGERKRGDP